MNAPGTYPPGQYLPSDFLATSRTYLQGAPVSFGEAIRQAFRNGFVYRGRASRSAYWWFALFAAIFPMVFFGVVQAIIALITTVNGRGSIGTHPGAAFTIPVLLLFAYLGLVTLALLVRRLHDTDRSGWWILIAFVPTVGGIVLLIFSLLAGTPGPNQYRA
jgi:uncharacterized membrane protein YhaH (DUF805 family)